MGELTGGKAALASHPDKVPENEREQAEVKFKAVSQAYEILYDDQKRQRYDADGMAAFDPRNGGDAGDGLDLDEMLREMFGLGAGASRGPGAGPGRRKPRKGQDEEIQYDVTLEELYKGKTVKFASEKKVVCSQCGGSGGKPNTKPKDCASCQGAGMFSGLSFQRRWYGDADFEILFRHDHDPSSSRPRPGHPADDIVLGMQGKRVRVQRKGSMQEMQGKSSGPAKEDVGNIYPTGR